MEKPNIGPGEWIYVEGVSSVVCQIYKMNPPDIEVVFMDKGKAVNTDAIWDRDRWIFASNEMGGYAGNYPRLAKFVAILRHGRQFHKQ